MEGDATAVHICYNVFRSIVILPYDRSSANDSMFAFSEAVQAEWMAEHRRVVSGSEESTAYLSGRRRFLVTWTHEEKRLEDSVRPWRRVTKGAVVTEPRKLILIGDPASGHEAAQNAATAARANMTVDGHVAVWRLFWCIDFEGISL